MPGSTIAILGGGWGGLTAAHHLRAMLGPEHRVVVVERNDRFSFCPSYLWLMTGERGSPDEVQRPMASLARPGIEWLHEEVLEIDPDTLSVKSASGRLRADQLIVALGVENAPDGVPGFADAALNLYDAKGAIATREALRAFEGGRIVVLIASTPFRCPGAPYEAAFLIETLVRERGLRERVEIDLYTPERQPLTAAGPAVGAAVVAMLEERSIGYHPLRAVRRVDGAARKIAFDEEEVSWDLLVGIPPHRVPAVVGRSGLADASGYIPVHPQTLEILADVETLKTRNPGVFVLGDIAAIRLLNSMFLPKTGAFAEAEALIVAQNVAAAIRGAEPAARFDGIGGCYVEVGLGRAAYATGNYFAYPGPTTGFEPPSVEHRRAKEQYEKVLVNWFAG